MLKTLVGLVLSLVGAGIMLTGAWIALSALLGLYQAALQDPLGQPEGTEKDVSVAMLRGVYIGAAGIVPFLIGSVLLKTVFFRRLARRRP